MRQSQIEANPFMLMLQPEVVLAAMEKSERLSSLNRHLCRPLDRQGPPGSHALARPSLAEDGDEGDERAS